MTLNSARGKISLMLAVILGITFFSTSLSFQANAATFADPAFQRLWNRTDQQVSDGRVSRTYLWGPEPFTAATQENYMEAPNGSRLVQYFDKSRMEINNPGGDQSNPFYVTNGLLARELISGQLQLGDNMFDGRAPANIGVAGDIDDTSGPTYATLNGFTGATTNATGNPVTKMLGRDGTQSDGTADFGKYNVTQADFESATDHNIASPFWTFLNQTGPVQNPGGQVVNGRLFDPVFYATGLPITEAWWAKVKVAGTVKDVLVQAFERRVLTYTPSNPAGFQVEMGNVGRHYYLWRYGTTGASATPTPTPTTQPTTPATNVTSVMIHNFSFMPQSISIPKGTTITWTNMDTAPHTVTSDTGAFASGNLQTNDTFRFTFNTPGTFTYHCAIHPHMKATITVTG
jgi:plastocyanin